MKKKDFIFVVVFFILTFLSIMFLYSATRLSVGEGLTIGVLLFIGCVLSLSIVDISGDIRFFDIKRLRVADVKKKSTKSKHILKLG